jgi:hypothetical protein
MDVVESAIKKKLTNMPPRNTETKLYTLFYCSA